VRSHGCSGERREREGGTSVFWISLGQMMISVPLPIVVVVVVVVVVVGVIFVTFSTVRWRTRLT